MKLITKGQMKKLIDKGKIRNTRHGYINTSGETIGYYRTRGGKCYVEDEYICLVDSL